MRRRRLPGARPLGGALTRRSDAAVQRVSLMLSLRTMLERRGPAIFLPRIQLDMAGEHFFWVRKKKGEVRHRARRNRTARPYHSRHAVRHLRLCLCRCTHRLERLRGRREARGALAEPVPHAPKGRGLRPSRH